MRGLDGSCRPHRRPVVGHAAAALAAAILVAGCGSSGTPVPTAPVTSEIELDVVEEGVHNKQDEAFAREMVANHRQSVALARLAVGRTENAKILALARRVEETATPEIGQLTQWAALWGAAVPTSTSASADIQQTVSRADLNALTAATGGDFDRRFLVLLTRRRSQAVDLARGQVKSGADERAKGLAADIAATAEADVAEMKALLG
jgi:uncharacterized protein (DUF305 family)